MTTDYTFSFLRPEDMSMLHETFLKAFSDYMLPIHLTPEQFNAKVKREGIVPSFCVGAYAGEEMVGFILTGLGEWKGQPTAYNAGTGVVFAHRGNQLTRRMYELLLPKLRESGTELCLLEVIHKNESAFKVYKNLGFEITRSVDSYRATKENFVLQAPQIEDVAITLVKMPDWSAYQNFCAYEPTWQNTAVAYNHFPNGKAFLEARTETSETEASEVVGYIAFLIENGAVLQLAVHPDFRDRGIGTALLREALRVVTGKALMFINIHTEASGFISFLERRNFTRFLSQYEMVLPLH